MRTRIGMLLPLLMCSVQSYAQTDFDDLLLQVDAMQAEPSSDSQINVLATIEAGGTYHSINMDSRLNPDNEILDVEDNGHNLEVELEVSDTVNDAGTLRWLLKTHNFFDSDLEREEYARIDELFIDYNPGTWFTSVGKRRLNWGHAFAFNPVNVVVPPRNLLNPNQESEGHHILWLQNSSKNYSADLVYTRHYIEGIHSYQWGARLNREFDSFDASLYYFDGDDYSPDAPYPRMAGASFSVDVGDGTTLFGEYANFDYNARNYYQESGVTYREEKGYNEWVIGASSRFGLENTVLVELYHNDAGYSEKQRADYLAVVDGNIGSSAVAALSEDFVFTKMARNYLLLGYEKIYRENMNYIFRGLLSEDKSLLFGMIGSYTFAEHYAVELEWRHTQGGADSEFGNDIYKDSLKLSINITI